ncbi:DNA repair protein RAD51 homolog 4 isoform X2 [Aotus nancymaae]|uniref:DNA repair protein RAD51 homolog 4 isoform X2 n=2 Tax=Aotus nancymaae TaxID=37293 RepID=UPI0030FEC0EA
MNRKLIGLGLREFIKPTDTEGEFKWQPGRIAAASGPCREMVEWFRNALKKARLGHGGTDGLLLNAFHERGTVFSTSHLDKLLDAGLYTGEVTEIVGGPGSGKTQVCLCVAANVAHGLQQNVLYIDSSGGLTASRLLQLLQAKTQDEEEQAEALQRIQVVYAFDIFQMLDVLQELRGTVVQQVTGSSGTVKVVVVDSVTAVVSPLLGGQQREGLALMMQLARELKTLARDLGMAVVVTNHITRDRDSGRLKPALGRSWSFVPSTRILLDTIDGAGASGGRRMACLTKSPRQPTGFQEMVDIGTWGTSEQSTML